MSAKSLQVVLLFKQQVANSSSAESYHIEVVRAPGRGWGGPFIPLGIDENQILDLRRLYRGYIERQQTVSVGNIGDRDLEPLRVVGRQLFDILPESIQARIHHAQSIAREKGVGLEIVLAFDNSAKPLLSLPWELLFDPEGRYFYALQGGGISRQFHLPMTPRRAPTAPSRKCLGLWAEPDGVESLAIRRGYYPSPEHAEGFTWITGRDSMGQLRRSLDAEKYDCLHIVAHGRLGSSWQDFELALVDEVGRPDWVSPDQLVVLLSDHSWFELVYLDVCASADSDSRDEREYSSLDYSWSNLASDLLGHGISVVVAMQDSISQNAAGLAARTFYTERAQGVLPSQAMARSRREVRLQLDDPIHWSVPAIYQQTRPPEEGNIFIQLADLIVDLIPMVLKPGLFSILSAVILSIQLARYLARTPLQAVENWLDVGLPVVASVLLVLLGALSMWGGYPRLRELYKTDWREWLRILLRKYSAASIFGFMWWLVIWVVWLLLDWFKPVDVMDVSARIGIWSLFLLGIFAAGFVGARQSIRQSILFLHERGMKATWSDWLLFLVTPFFPVGLAWIFISSWGYLISDLGAFLVVLALTVLFIWLTGRRSDQP